MKNSFRYISIVVFILSLLTTACAHAEQIVTITKNLNYNSQGQLLDVYVPQARDKQTAIMFIHGGGFKKGSKEEMSGYAKLYAKGGFVTTSINYRLTPNHIFPAAISDTVDALRWMKEHADEYGFNPNKIVLVGYSAGGTLALNLGLSDDIHVAAAVSVAGATDLGLLMLPQVGETELHRQLREDLATYMGGRPPELASPISQVSKDDPPIFLFHGDKDKHVSVDQSILLAKKLEKNSVPVLLRIFPDADHGIMYPNKHLKQLLKEMTDFVLAIEKQ
jgi:acetyl esterase/lipase